MPPTGCALAHIQTDIGEAAGAANCCGCRCPHTFVVELRACQCDCVCRYPHSCKVPHQPLFLPGSSWHGHRSDAGLTVSPRLTRSNTSQNMRASTRMQHPTKSCAPVPGFLCCVRHNVLSRKPMSLNTRLRDESGLSEIRGAPHRKGGLLMKFFTAAWAKVNSGAEGGPGESHKNLLFLNLGVPRKSIETIARIHTIAL